MVKSTYALTLFAAVSLAAPIEQPGARADKHGVVEHKNLIDDLPIVGSLLGNKHDKRSADDSPTDILDDLPVVGSLLGNSIKRRDIGTEGISGLPIIGGLFGKHAHTGGVNGMTQSRRDLGALSGLPIIGDLLGKDQEKPSHKQTNDPAKQLDTRDAGHAKGIFGMLQSLTSGSPITKSQKRFNQEFSEIQSMSELLEDAVESGMEAESSAMPARRSEPAAPKGNEGPQYNPKATVGESSNGLLGHALDQKKESADQKSDALLGQLMGKQGLGAIKGNSEHGLGILPMRRDTNALESRQAPPIEGSTLAGVLLSGGALGKVTQLLDPSTANHKPGENSPSNMGDGSSTASPDPASGAGPHSGPGLAAEKNAGAA
ncbi:hypothetical protein N7535_007309, partial [Penicillium sp. DV-2018c]